MQNHLSDVVRAASRALFRQLRRAQHGDARAIHRARVASRRLREALPQAPNAGQGRRRDSLIRDVRRVRRALGSVRELDVALGELRDDDRRSAFDPAALAYLVGYLTERRAERIHELEHKLDRVDPDKLSASIETLASRCRGTRTAAWRSHVTARVRKRSKRLAQALADAGTLYAPEPLHDVRIAAKKLRYTLELARAAGDAGVARDIGTLKRLQRLLGRLNDLEGLQQYVRDASAVCGDAGISAGLSAMQRQLEAECRQLHGRFLARSAQWMGIAERGARALPPLLGGTRAVKAAPPRLRLVRREKSA